MFGEILLWIYFGLILIALPCYLYLAWVSLKYMVNELWLFIQDEPNLILAFLHLIFGGLVVLVLFVIELVVLGVVLLLPFWNLWMFANWGCEVKNPFYK